VKIFRLIALWAAVVFATAQSAAAQTQVPTPPPRPAVNSDKSGQTTAPTAAKSTTKTTATTHAKPDTKSAAKKSAKKTSTAAAKSTSKAPAKSATRSAPAKTVTGSTPPLMLAPATLSGGGPAPTMPAAVAGRPAPAFAMATSTMTSPLDLAAVKQAIELAHKGRTGEATDIEGTISDPVARKVVEWVILRSDDTDAESSRYAAFIAANPSWPSVLTMRRRAEALLWQERPDPQTALAFFRNDAPRSAKGRFALARALLAQGDVAGAQQAIRQAWREDSFSGDVETQARAMFGTLITPADDKVRMDVRLYAEDDDAGLRAAHHLDDTQLAIAKARAAVINKANNARALLDAVPAAAQRDAGYIFSRIQWFRRTDKIAEAVQWMLAAPHDPAVVGDPDQWWIERRLLARKLLDLGEFKKAYEIASAAAPPKGENFRAEQQFTAGWIALRFLHEPTAALAHFARIADGVVNPITLARSFYWQGRAAEASGHDRDARGYYETAAHYSTAYYGQLARARLGLDEVNLRRLPEPAAELRGLEVARAFEILYAIDARDIIASMSADLGDKATDGAALTALADITSRHNDARATLLIGKLALGRGMPFEQFAFPDFGVPDFQQIGPQVDRSVIYSIVRQESAFNPRDVSSANALGLMQVTPAAGRDTAKRFNVPFDQRRLGSDIVYNAQLGTAELGNDLATWRGSYILAFVAYNAGPRRAKEWIEQYGDPRDPKVDPIDWIERIPISETRNYVQRVLENMQIYRARLDNNTKLSIEADLRRGG